MKKHLLPLLGLCLSILPANAEWSTDISRPNQLMPAGTNVYATEYAATPDGGLWHIFRQTVGVDETDFANVRYQWRLQYIDPEGNPCLGEYGTLISEYRNVSWTRVNSYLGIDNDGNAIVAVDDLRHAPEGQEKISWTAYKFDRQGNQLWGDGDGVSIDDGYPHDYPSAMNILVLADNSVVFAWLNAEGDSQVFSIAMMRVSPDGELKWKHSEVDMVDPEGKVSYSYPYLVDAGHNQFYLVYFKGSNQDCYVRKLDFDCTRLWTEDTRVYRGGFGSVPLWTFFRVCATGNGGVAMTWHDDRYYDNVEEVYVSVVNPDGSLAYKGASADGDVRVGYSEMRMLGPSITAVGADKVFVAWHEYNSDQSWSGIRGQILSANGELEWIDEGAPLTRYKQARYIIGGVSPADEGKVALFYTDCLAGYGHDDVCLKVVDVATGPADTDPTEVFTPEPTDATSLHVCNVPRRSCWIIGWDQNAIVDKEKLTYPLLLVNYNGKVGEAGIGTITAAPATGVGAVYNLSGVKVGTTADRLAPGIYIVNDGQGNVSKIVRK